MSDDTERNDDDLVGDEVQWYRDPDGTEWFVDEGVRFELADDGFAYPVVGGTTDPSGATALEVVVDEQADAADTVDLGEPDDTADGPGLADDATEQQGRSPFAPPGPDDQTQVISVRADEGSSASDAGSSAQGAEEGATPPDTGSDLPPPAVTVEDRPASEPSTHGGRRGEPLLEIRGLDAGYGSLPVLKDVGLSIHTGETAVLLGLNGAGKTTTVSTVAGALDPWGGEIRFDGRDVSGWSTQKAVASGVVMVPEGRRVFPELSVARNLQVGAWSKRGEDGHLAAQRERVFDYFPRLREREDQLAGTLSGGEQQMLAVGRGLMADPRLLIIDEASMGLAPVIVQDVFDIVAQINQDGVTVLMVEQNVGVLEVADVGYVMEQGRIVRVLEGEELRDRSVVSEALMG